MSHIVSVFSGETNPGPEQAALTKAALVRRAAIKAATNL